MTDVMMLLGPYPFMLQTAAYDSLKRTAGWRWQKQARIGRKPANQLMGADLETLSLSGTILPHFKGGIGQIELMRQAGAIERPLTLVDGRGFVWGRWVIKKVAENDSVFFSDGVPRKMGFSLTLEEYGDDDGGFGRLTAGIAAVSALARLL